MRCGLLVLSALVWWASGCSRDAGLRCEDQERYADAQEIPPLEIPNDLDRPDDAEALQVPGVAESVAEAGAPDYGPCTESPPEFFEEGEAG